MKTEKHTLNNIYKDLVDLIGIENVRVIYKEYRGQQVSFPLDFYNKEYIYKCIRKEFDGTNAKALAQKYDYSERTIRRIVSEKD